MHRNDHVVVVREVWSASSVHEYQHKVCHEIPRYQQAMIVCQRCVVCRGYMSMLVVLRSQYDLPPFFRYDGLPRNAVVCLISVQGRRLILKLPPLTLTYWMPYLLQPSAGPVHDPLNGLIQGHNRGYRKVKDIGNDSYLLSAIRIQKSGTNYLGTWSLRAFPSLTSAKLVAP